MTRLCLWPGCKRTVQARFWGCRAHWYQLPEYIRSHIWAAYRTGLESDGRPLSREYLAAIREAEEWIKRFERSQPGRPVEPGRPTLPGLEL